MYYFSINFIHFYRAYNPLRIIRAFIILLLQIQYVRHQYVLTFIYLFISVICIIIVFVFTLERNLWERITA